MIEFYFFIATLLSSDAVSNMHPTSSKSEDRESSLLNDEEGMVEVNLEDPWVRRDDFKPKRRGRAFGECERNYLNSTRYLAKYSFRVLFILGSYFNRADSVASQDIYTPDSLNYV